MKPPDLQFLRQLLNDWAACHTPKRCRLEAIEGARERAKAYDGWMSYTDAGIKIIEDELKQHETVEPQISGHGLSRK